MPQVVVTIDGKTYRMACAEGEEEHLAGLAADVDRRVASLKGNFGEIGDQRLTVMAAMMATDELVELRRRMQAMEDELAEMKSRQSQTLQAIDAREGGVVSHLLEAAEAIEEIATRLERRT